MGWLAAVPSEVAATAVSVSKFFWLESGSVFDIERGGFPSLIAGGSCRTVVGAAELVD